MQEPQNNTSKQESAPTLKDVMNTFAGSADKFSSSSFLTGGLATVNPLGKDVPIEFRVGGTMFTLAAALLLDKAQGENSKVAKHLENMHINPYKLASAIAMLGSGTIGLMSAMKGRWLTALPTLFFAPAGMLSITADGKGEHPLTKNVGLTHAILSVFGSGAVIADGYATGLASVKTAGFSFMTDALTRLAKETGILPKAQGATPAS